MDMIKKLLLCGTALGTVALALMNGQSWANPSGPTVVSTGGQVLFNGSPDFPAGNPSDLTISSGPGAILNWQSFSIGAGERTHFDLALPHWSILNRVTGQDPSTILGTLSSTGRVFLVNPNGTVFGPESIVDVRSLVVSTRDITNEDFLAGAYLFQGDSPGDILLLPGAEVIARGNQGVASDQSADVWFIARDIGIAPGATIRAGSAEATPNGNVLLLAGQDVRVEEATLGEGTHRVHINTAALTGNGSNDIAALGQIVARRGTIGAFADSIVLGGRIDLVGGDDRGEALIARATTDLAIAPDTRIDAGREMPSWSAIDLKAGRSIQIGDRVRVSAFTIDVDAPELRIAPTAQFDLRDSQPKLGRDGRAIESVLDQSGRQIEVNLTGDPEAAGAPAIAALPDGSAVVVWEAALGDPAAPGGGLVARTIGPDGSLGAVRRIADGQGSLSFHSVKIGALEGGRYVVTHLQAPAGEDPTAGQVFATLFDAEHQQALAFPVAAASSALGQEAIDPQLAALPGGGFAIAYRTEVAGGGERLVFHRFESSGVDLGRTETDIVNPCPCRIAALADGSIVIAGAQDPAIGEWGSYLRAQVFRGSDGQLLRSFQDTPDRWGSGLRDFLIVPTPVFISQTDQSGFQLVEIHEQRYGAGNSSANYHYLTVRTIYGGPIVASGQGQARGQTAHPNRGMRLLGVQPLADGGVAILWTEQETGAWSWQPGADANYTLYARRLSFNEMLGGWTEPPPDIVVARNLSGTDLGGVAAFGDGSVLAAFTATDASADPRQHAYLAPLDASQPDGATTAIDPTNLILWNSPSPGFSRGEFTPPVPTNPPPVNEPPPVSEPPPITEPPPVSGPPPVTEEPPSTSQPAVPGQPAAPGQVVRQALNEQSAGRMTIDNDFVRNLQVAALSSANRALDTGSSASGFVFGTPTLVAVPSPDGRGVDLVRQTGPNLGAARFSALPATPARVEFTVERRQAWEAELERRAAALERQKREEREARRAAEIARWGDIRRAANVYDRELRGGVDYWHEKRSELDASLASFQPQMSPESQDRIRRYIDGERITLTEDERRALYWSASDHRTGYMRSVLTTGKMTPSLIFEEYRDPPAPPAGGSPWQGVADAMNAAGAIATGAISAGAAVVQGATEAVAKGTADAAGWAAGALEQMRIDAAARAVAGAPGNVTGTDISRWLQAGMTPVEVAAIIRNTAPRLSLDDVALAIRAAGRTIDVRQVAGAQRLGQAQVSRLLGGGEAGLTGFDSARIVAAMDGVSLGDAMQMVAASGGSFTADEVWGSVLSGAISLGQAGGVVAAMFQSAGRNMAEVFGRLGSDVQAIASGALDNVVRDLEAQAVSAVIGNLAAAEGQIRGRADQVSEALAAVGVDVSPEEIRNSGDLVGLLSERVGEVDQKTAAAAIANLAAVANSRLGSSGAGLIGQAGGNLIGHAGGNLIGHAGGNLIGHAGGNLIGHAGGNLIGHAGGN